MAEESNTIAFRVFAAHKGGEAVQIGWAPADRNMRFPYRYLDSTVKGAMKLGLMVTIWREIECSKDRTCEFWIDNNHNLVVEDY